MPFSSTRIYNGTNPANVNAVGSQYALAVEVLNQSMGTGLTAAAPGTANASITSATIVAANASRKGLVIVNLSGKNVSFGFSGQAAVVSRGVTLAPDGIFNMGPTTFTTGAVTAITTGADSALAFQEWT